MTADFLLELRCEEIPARMQAKASEDLARLFTDELAKAGLKPERITSFVTPRRLALIAHGLPQQTAAVSEEYKGPRTNAPQQALDGFLRKTGLTQDQLEDRDGVWFAVVNRPGRATADVLADAVPTVVRAFPWPKSMRWGEASSTTESLRWVRPLQGIIAILGEDVVPMAIDSIAAGRETAGHRFHSSGVVTVASAATYADDLRKAFVIVSHEERQAIIAAKAAALAGAAGYSLIEDHGLVAENAGLTEWPVPLLGHFDPSFLEVPPEVIQLTLRINQKYFVLRDASGKLAPAFICTANIEAKDGGAAIVAGNGKVLAARLSDARFFWEQDRKTALADHAKKLERITFHEKLGTVADKVERVAKLARWLVEEGIVTPAKAGVPGGGAVSPEMPASAGMTKDELADLAEQAARLCKADLVTEMVGEFPELQGLMGGYYARAEGLPDAVADAIRDHYKPVGQGDDVPTAPVTVAVSLADKLDTLVGFFAIEELPTGSKDPFALRRAALGIIRIISETCLRVSLGALIDRHGIQILMTRLGPTFDRIEDFSARYKDLGSGIAQEINRREALAASRGPAEIRDYEITDALLDFFADRLKVQQREAGVRHDLIDAVFALGQETGQIEDDLVRLLARVKALQAFVETPEGANLLAGYRRAANILKKEGIAPSVVTPAKPGVSVEGAPTPQMPGSAGMTDLGAVAPPADEDSGMPDQVRHDGVGSDYTPEPAEAALATALATAEPAVDAAIASEDFAAAMTALASLRAPIDAFFEGVIVNDPDPAKRAARLATLVRIRAAMHKVADFSRIEG